MVVKVSFAHSEEKHEECGIVAIYSKKGEDVAPYIYRALIALQHRGQDAAGLVVYDGTGLIAKKGIGLVNDIFNEESLKVKGSIGIGHTRYPTTGRCLIDDVQPSVIGKVSVSHNGHLANYSEIKKSLEKAGRPLKCTVDSEPIANIIDIALKEGKGIDGAIKSVIEALDGAYSDAAIIDGKLVVFRDPHAIRPLVYGENEEFICFASETSALDINGIPYTGDLKGGERAIVEKGKVERKLIASGEIRHCMFEYVYFARPDSLINGKEVFSVRKRLGEILAKEHPVEADAVIPLPDTARTAAETFSRVSGIDLEEGLIKNRYIGRTFIMPSQDKRIEAVRLKLNAVRSVINGRRVVLIDDSIVRGTTLREIVKLVKSAGATQVHLRITSPPIRFPCFYGVDMATFKELVANKKSVDEIKKFLGADSLGYLSIEGLKEAIGLPICTGCLDGEYITQYARKLASERKEGEKGCG